jgi:hypothetical protein
MSSIRIHLRRAIVSTRLSLEINLRYARVHITDLIADWGHYGTNRRCAKGGGGRTSPISKKSEMHFNLPHR